MGVCFSLILGPLRPYAWAMFLASCASLLVSTACGSERQWRSSNPQAAAGAGADEAAGAGRSGSGAGNLTGGASNTIPTECDDPDALRCQGNVRERCTADGEWQPLPDSEQCGGALPACDGDGVCAAYRQRAGGIDAFATYPSALNAASYVLRRQTLTTSPKACGSDYCVRGGVTP